MNKILLVSLITILSCSVNNNQINTKLQQNADKIIQNINFDNYSKMWKEVEKFENKGLTESAYKVVKNIYKKAKNENNSPQLVKSLLYQSKYMLILQEDSQLQIIQNFKKEIKENNVPTSNILENYLAQLYWQYYQQNRWRFAQRSETAEKVNLEDFRTWDLKTIFKEIHLHFDRSLKNKNLLQNFSITKWKDILIINKKNRKYRPTLYDLLAHEALRFYQSDENTLTSPAYKFIIDNPDFLSNTNTFVKLSINTKDSISLQAKSLKIYQELLKFHLKKSKFSNQEALASADLERLNYVYKKAVFENKDSLYFKALTEFINEYKDLDIVSMAYYHQVQLLYKQGDDYSFGKNPKNRWKKKKALQIAETAVKNYPDSNGAKNCLQLIQKIKSKSFSLKLENNIPENQAALLHITYKNIDEVQAYIYKIDYSERFNILKIRHKDNRLKHIENLHLLKEFEINLTDTKDYQSHTTERILEPLPNGNYVILLKDKKSKQWTYGFLQVTDVVLQFFHETGEKNKMGVFNRVNGKPIANASVSIYKKNRNKLEFVKKEITGKNGYFKHVFPSRNFEKYIFIVNYDKVKKAGFNDYIFETYPLFEPRKLETAFIFTDRSIYRPGQIVYFKGIVLKKQKNRSQVLAHIPVNITFFDVNNQKIKELSLQTNEFGSVSGEFLIPTQTLTGNFSITITSPKRKIYRRKNIRVEAYKRPKFEVELMKPQKAYKVNEIISVKGIAKSYAESPISNAKVTYHIKRNVQNPRWWYWYRPAQNSESQEIAYGNLKTNDKGEFIITFKALPDLSVSPSKQPIFHYEIFTEVTDINGETHTATLNVKAGYQSILLDTQLPNILYKGKTDTIKIKATNLNDVEVSAEVDIKIYKLKAPDRILIKRPWKAPELQEISKEKFVQTFPHIPYDKTEEGFYFWENESLVFTKKINTFKTKKIAFTPENQLKTGKYVLITSTNDANGEKITSKLYFELKDLKQSEIPDHKYFDFFITKYSYQPGETVKIHIGSKNKNTIIRYWIEKNHQLTDEKIIQTNGKYHIITVPVNETDRGGFAIHYVYYALNSYVKNTKIIDVPYPSKEIQIETLTFRDKLKPGEKEEWQFKITGPKGEKVAAELLASMYDASLDAFVPHNWNFHPINFIYYKTSVKIAPFDSYGIAQLQLPHLNTGKFYSFSTMTYEQLNWFGFQFGRRFYYKKRMKTREVQQEDMEGSVMGVSVMDVNEKIIVEENVEENTVPSDDFNENTNINDEKNLQINLVKPRKNLQETAFFFPKLYTDKKGNVSFGFTIPESLTKWKLQLLAHTTDLDFGYKKLFAVTQKDLMIFPNAPRFVREKDQLILNVKVSNLSQKQLQGIANIELIDAVNQKNITDLLISEKAQKHFSVESNGNVEVSWRLNIPESLELLQYKVTAKAGQYTDAEQNVIPVLSNRMLVTETIPLWVRGNKNKTFVMEKLAHHKSKTLKNHQLTLEVTTNPAWYAVQAIPYLIEYPYECSEQIFSRYYANTLASDIIRKNPIIKNVFDSWKNLESDALLSNLEKNQELKSIIIEETPWLRDAQSENEQKKRIALLFDLNKMAYEQDLALDKLQQMQLHDGGFPWFKGGMYSNRYITQHIVEGFGHLKHLNIPINNHKITIMLKKAIEYLDQQMINDYQELQKAAQLQKNSDKYLNEYRPNPIHIHYLYTRSFFKNIKINKKLQQVFDYYIKQAEKHWLDYSLYTKALLALTFHRNNHTKMAQNIIRSLDENSIKSEEMGMYWKENTSSWLWYNAPIETQALLIEAFDEIEKDIHKVDEMRIWLLKNKQTNAWKTTKQTTQAIYALLLRGSNWLSIDNNIQIKIGNEIIDPLKNSEIKTEAGIGYFKKSWKGKEIKPEMGHISIHKKGKGIAWGGLYWQYFGDLDKISHYETPLSIRKELFIRRFTDSGEKLIKINPENKIKVGDLIRVRIEIIVDRDMEFIHLKDMHASGFEQVNILSGYRWQDGLGYYESTRDASTNFFISYLPKGVYVFEYDLRANNKGSFSNGITTIQSMYAPEYSSHSKGIKVEIK